MFVWLVVRYMLQKISFILSIFWILSHFLFFSIKELFFFFLFFSSFLFLSLSFSLFACLILSFISSHYCSSFLPFLFLSFLYLSRLTLSFFLSFFLILFIFRFSLSLNVFTSIHYLSFFYHISPLSFLYLSTDWTIGLMSRVLANSSGDQVSIPGRVIPKTPKMVLDSAWLSIIRYGSRVKWINPGNEVVPSPTPQSSSYWKRSPRFTLDYGHHKQLPFNRSVYHFFFLSFIYFYVPSCSFLNIHLFTFSIKNYFLFLSFFFFVSFFFSHWYFSFFLPVIFSLDLFSLMTFHCCSFPPPPPPFSSQILIVFRRLFWFSFAWWFFNPPFAYSFSLS